MSIRSTPKPDGVLCSKTTRVGKVTGTARVVHELSQIGRVKQGDT
ncbi:hypothetical protein [Castellaniella defragrans]|nr:hypothetical protein [Castellaniella defragrans]